jgi:TRAP-type C4-dicarboxylate transport system permease small subunit
MVKTLARLEFALSAALLGIIVLLVFVAAVMRSLGHPLIWSVDMAQLLFIWLCFFGACRAMREKGHLGIDLLARYLPGRRRFQLEFVLTVVILVFLLMLAYEGYGLTMLNLARQFGDSGLSYAWVTSAVPVGSLLLAIALAANLVRAWPWRETGRRLIYSRTEDEAPVTTEL